MHRIQITEARKFLGLPGSWNKRDSELFIEMVENLVVKFEDVQGWTGLCYKSENVER